MIRSSRFVVLAGMVGLAAVGALVVSSKVASARSLPAGYSGSPDPWGEAGCWVQDGPRIFLSTACYDGQPHFYQIALPIDSATTVAAARFHGSTCTPGTLCLTDQTLCSRTATYNADGTYFHGQGKNCSIPNGFVNSGFVSIPVNGTATLDSWQTATFGSPFYISSIVYTP